MPRVIICPACGESDALKGSQSPEGIRIACGSCGHDWLRDDEPDRCATCGGLELVTRPQALTQYSRGTQLSIVGMGEIVLCRSCDAEMVEWASGARPTPFNYRSAAETKRDPDDADPDIRITP